jgi:hypothetical protein
MARERDRRGGAVTVENKLASRERARFQQLGIGTL